jgi:hypothetical protein
MADAKVTFLDKDLNENAAPGQEAYFDFACPKRKRPCGSLLIAGRTDVKRDGQNKNGGHAQWDWDGNRESPTFSPSINCGACWHGYIRKGRTVDCANVDEPEIRT